MLEFMHLEIALYDYIRTPLFDDIFSPGFFYQLSSFKCMFLFSLFLESSIKMDPLFYTPTNGTSTATLPSESKLATYMVCNTRIII